MFLGGRSIIRGFSRFAGLLETNPPRSAMIDHNLCKTKMDVSAQKYVQALRLPDF
jgi:hypothetical protein